MFTGIIETVGLIEAVESDGTNLHFWVKSEISNQLQIDQSVSHNGVCLTVVEIDQNMHKVTAVEETLVKSNLSALKEGSGVNLERSMPANGRFDGHIVQGHVDGIVRCASIEDKEGSWYLSFDCQESGTKLIVEKGSICINGISLTCFDVDEQGFSVAIIPFTYEHTNIHELKAGTQVNLEYDIVGKYIQKLLGSEIRG